MKIIQIDLKDIYRPLYPLPYMQFILKSYKVFINVDYIENYKAISTI